MAEEIGDRSREIVVRSQEPRTPGHHAVSIVVRVARPRDVETVLESDQPLHRVGGGRIHADLPVPIHGHEAEGRIHLVAHHAQRNPPAFRDHLPVAHTGAAQWIDTESQLCLANHLEIHDVAEVSDVGAHVVVAAGRGRGNRPLEGNALHVRQPPLEEHVGFVLDRARDARGRGAAIWGVVLEAAILRRVVRRRDDDAIGETTRASAIVREDGVREHRGGRVAVSVVDHDGHAVGREHLERAGERRLREGVGVDAEKQGSVDSPLATMGADRLGDGQDVGLVEGAIERGAAMARRPERHALFAHGGVRTARVIRRHQSRDIGEHRGECGLSRCRIRDHLGGHSIRGRAPAPSPIPPRDFRDPGRCSPLPAAYHLPDSVRCSCAPRTFRRSRLCPTARRDLRS